MLFVTYPKTLRMLSFLLFQLLSMGAQGNQESLRHPIIQENISGTNKLYLGLSNHLYFDTAKVNVIQMLPGADMQVEINPGFLAVKPHKVGRGCFEINTSLGVKLISYVVLALQDNKQKMDSIMRKKLDLVFK